MKKLFRLLTYNLILILLFSCSGNKSGLNDKNTNITFSEQDFKTCNSSAINSHGFYISEAYTCDVTTSTNRFFFCKNTFNFNSTKCLYELTNLGLQKATDTIGVAFKTSSGRYGINYETNTLKMQDTSLTNYALKIKINNTATINSINFIKNFTLIDSSSSNITYERLN